MFIFELYESKMNFIDGNWIMTIKNERGKIKLKFLNACTKVDSEFRKISNYYKYGTLRTISGWIFAENKQIVSRFLTFALANFLIQFISLMTE